MTGDYIFILFKKLQKWITYKSYKDENHEIVDGFYGTDIPGKEPPRNTSLEISINVGVFIYNVWQVIINGDL